jgi:hypothetical protein
MMRQSKWEQPRRAQRHLMDVMYEDAYLPSRRRKSHRSRSRSSSTLETPPITIATVRKSDTGKRIRDKRLACLICKQQVLNLSRHLTRKHSNNVMVAEVMSKNGPERKTGLLKLRNLGSFHNNIRVLKKGTGNLVVVRRSHTMKRIVKVNELTEDEPPEKARTVRMMSILFVGPSPLFTYWGLQPPSPLSTPVAKRRLFYIKIFYIVFTVY